MLELRHFLPLERPRVEAPNHTLKLFAGPRHWVIFRITPARSHIVEIPIARECQPAAVVCEHINRERCVTRLCCRSKILNSWPLPVIQPDAHQVRIRTPSRSVDTFAVWRGRNIIKDAMPAGLVFASWANRPGEISKRSVSGV